ncbi:3996_t:CDS:2 [Dentiscutata erythropus]|uniref:3996_t:CDS:1 n=1 Tax=Dentiscutata erythropus TaxID=1348616 RepID=A0A9N9NG56_9GLOM|nr:3996_t:CDS:2 [Dentiscutata erythropus]
MPCYADTIVKINYVKQNVSSKDPNLLVMWALGSYSVKRDDYYIKMTLFVPSNSDDRDSETQAVFIKDIFFLVGGKIMPGFFEGKKRAKMTDSTSTYVMILNKVVGSNKYLLKFSHLKSNIQPRESLIFIVGQLEIIGNEHGDSQVFLSSKNSIQSKLLVTHHNIAEKSKFKPEHEVGSSVISGDSVDKIDLKSSISFHVLRYVRVKDCDDSSEDFCYNENEICNNSGENFEEKFKKDVSLSQSDYRRCNNSNNSSSSKRACFDDYGEFAGEF